MFKVGQRVRVMNLHELGAHFDKDPFGGYDAKFGFTPRMIKELCGKVFTITGIDNDDGEVLGHGTLYSISHDVLVGVYEVGEEVEIKSWDEMASKYNLDCDGDIEVPNKTDYTHFTDEMKEFCGRRMKITSVKDEEAEKFYLDGGGLYVFVPHMLKKCEQTAAKEVSDAKDEDVLRTSDLKAGMMVQVKSWDEINEFQDSRGRSVLFGWNPNMTKVLCGKKFIITHIENNHIYGHNTSWSVSAEMLKLVDAAEDKKAKIEELQAQIDALKKEIEEEQKAKSETYKLYADEDCSEYYYIQEEGSIDYYYNDGDSTDTELYEYANFFTSEEAALKVSKQQQLLRQLQRFAEINDAQVYDWSKSGEAKYYISSNTFGELEIAESRKIKMVGTVYFSDKDVAKEAIKVFGASIKELL